MTRVTFATYDDTPPLGGQGVVLEGMRAALQRRGVFVHCISGRGEHAIPYRRVTGRAPLDLSLHLNLHPSVLTRERPDVVHAFGGPGGVILLRRINAPLVYTAHHTYAQAHARSSPYRLPAPLEARSYRLAAMVLTVSPSTANAVRAMGIPPAKIEVMPPGIDIVDSNDTARDAKRVLFVGRLRADKGVLDALDVMCSLVREHDANGVIIGDGPLVDGVRRRIQTEPRITHHGAADRRTLADHYAHASVLLMPSRYEGLGLVALEAQAAGTPVVGYDVDGLRHAVVTGGVLVPYGDVQQLRAATAELLHDESKRTELGTAGREFVRAHHSWDSVAVRLEQIYDQLRSAGNP